MKTAKEKAAELYQKHFDNFYLNSYHDNDVDVIKLTKDACIITVDEIINSIDEIWFSFCEDNNIDKVKEYWKEVRTEITKL